MHNKLEGWEWLVIIAGVVITALLFGLIGVAIFAIIQDRPVAFISVFVIVISLMALWAITWGALWLTSGMRTVSSTVPPAESTLAERLAELQEENERLKRQLAEKSPHT